MKLNKDELEIIGTFRYFKIHKVAISIGGTISFISGFLAFYMMIIWLLMPGLIMFGIVAHKTTNYSNKFVEEHYEATKET